MRPMRVGTAGRGGCQVAGAGRGVRPHICTHVRTHTCLHMPARVKQGVSFAAQECPSAILHGFTLIGLNANGFTLVSINHITTMLSRATATLFSLWSHK